MSMTKTIQAAILGGSARFFDNGKTVMVNGVLYKVQNGAVKYKRLPGQKQNFRRLGIMLATPAPTAVKPIQVETSSRAIAGPAAVERGKRAHTADYVQHVRKLLAAGRIPQPSKAS